MDTIINKQFSTYSIDFLAMESGQHSDNILIDISSDFEVFKTTYLLFDSEFTPLTSDLRIIAPINILITSTKDSRQLMNQPVPIDSIFGSGERPFILNHTMVLPAGSQLNIDVYNNASYTYNLYLNFIGIRRYYND